MRRSTRSAAGAHGNAGVAGTRVTTPCSREDKLEALREDGLRSHPHLTVTVLAEDLSEHGAGSRIAERVDAAGITIDLLVNNAGVGSHGPFIDEDTVAMARQIQLNVGSLVELTAKFLPGMVARDSGAVINVASTAAFQPVPTMAVYGATKAFVLSFTEALWAKSRGSAVRVVTLCPGATETAFFENTGKNFLTGSRQSPAEVAALALHALQGTSPTVVSGLSNRLGATGYRFLPRSLMARLSANQVKEAA